jgi:hypothetical protein
MALGESCRRRQLGGIEAAAFIGVSRLAARNIETEKAGSEKLSSVAKAKAAAAETAASINVAKAIARQ